MNATLRNQLLTQITAITKRARPLVAAIGCKDDSLESQLRRSPGSIALNVAEGFGVHAGNARLRFRTALGSFGRFRLDRSNEPMSAATFSRTFYSAMGYAKFFGNL